MVTRGLSVVKAVVDDAEEPVTLDELKRHLAIDFDAHDELLADLLYAARESVEKYTNLSLIDTNLTVRWEALTTRPLPYGPVKSITSVKDKDNVDITTHTLEGQEGGQMSIKADREEPTIVKYVAGFDQVPNALRLAVMKCASDDFTNRTGISLENNVAAQRLPNDWRATARPFMAKTWIG